MCPLCPLDTNGHDGQFIMMSNGRPFALDVHCVHCIGPMDTVNIPTEPLLQTYRGSVGMLTVSIGPMDTMDVHWTALWIVHHVHWCPMDTLCPFKGQNGHFQWTQWTSIGSILMCPIDPLTALQLHFLLILFNGHNVSIVPTVSIAHNGCPMDKTDVQWTQWTSMLRRFMTQLGVTVIFYCYLWFVPPCFVVPVLHGLWGLHFSCNL